MLRITKIVNFIVMSAIVIFMVFNGALNTSTANGEDYLAFAEKMPEPIGGLPAIYSKIQYPDIALKAGIQGKVFLLAFIDEAGAVHDVKVLKGIGGGCDEAAIDAVKSTKFSPGTNKGKPVKVKLSLTINFKLK